MITNIDVQDQSLAYMKSSIESVIPEQIKVIAQWLTWRAGTVKTDGKFDKLPFGRNGTGKEWQQSHQWMSFEEALEAAKSRNHSGIGLVLPALLTDGSHLIALDFDDVDVKNHVSNNRLVEIQAIHERLGKPYIEVSPSGKGLRMFVASADRIAQISSANPFGGKDELFCASGKWVTVTGEQLSGAGVPVVTDEIKAIAERWTAIAKPTKRTCTVLNTPVNTQLLSNLIGTTWVGWPTHKLRDGDGREEQMLAYAGHLRAKGFDQADIERLCLDANRDQYEDLLDESIVLDKARRYAESRSSFSNSNAPIDIESSLLEQIDHTDAGNVALLFKLTGGDLRYVVERKQWIFWSGKRWQMDKGNAAVHQKILKVSAHHKKLAEKRMKEADAAGSPDQRKNLSKAANDSLKWSVQCRNKNRLDAMVTIAQRDSRFLIDANQLDCDPWLLGVSNGVIDLRTGILRPDSKPDFVLKRSPVAFFPNAQAPRWDKFIEEITSRPSSIVGAKITAVARPHLERYLHKALGYCLTGRVNEHIMFIAIGRGANGKNVLLDTFKSIAGDYCETIAPEVLMATRLEGSAEQASPSTRKLAGARCAVGSESKDGQRLDIAVVKRHTGGGSMTARSLHENPMTFDITHKLWLMTNHSPRVDHMDDATKGRLHLIPFDMKWNRPSEARPDPTLPNADKKLMDTLASEKEGILRWLVTGAVKYYAEGLIPPDEVVGFTNSYIESQDLLARWLKEVCDICPIDQGMLSKDLLANYKDFCLQEDETPQIDSQTTLSKKIKSLGYASKRTNVGWRFGLKPLNFQAPVQALQDIESLHNDSDKSLVEGNVIRNVKQ